MNHLKVTQLLNQAKTEPQCDIWGLFVHDFKGKWPFVFALGLILAVGSLKLPGACVNMLLEELVFIHLCVSWLRTYSFRCWCENIHML